MPIIKRIGDILIAADLITNEQLSEALGYQKQTGERLGKAVVSLGFLTEDEILTALGEQLDCPFISLDAYNIDGKVPTLIPEALAKKYNLLPVSMEKNKLTVAMSDPLDMVGVDDIKIATGFDVNIIISTERDIQLAIQRYYGKQGAAEAIADFNKADSDDIIENLNNLNINDIENAPAVRLVNSMVRQAVSMNASDIHIEPYENTIRIRYRVDGELQEIMTAAKSALSALITRIKIICKMDIAEKRLPQDGAVEINIDQAMVDIRVSVMPTVHGEKIVMRILNRNHFLLSKEKLGFTEGNLKMFNLILGNPNGIVLVTGPTGSGKSTTLYATLNEMNNAKKNIVTIEDPVEYKLDGINQVQINTKAGLTFASGLRSILRQDPDIIMVGEIRDSETAEIAVRASITGHLVLSTIHTNDAISTITRLIDMGIEPYLVASSIIGVIAQRLVRKVCTRCCEDVEATELEKSILQIDPEEKLMLKKGKGCLSCNYTGYSGRCAVHEVIPMNKELKSMIERNSSMETIKEFLKKKNMVTIKDNGIRLVLRGITTVEELNKVIYSVD